MTIAAPRDEHTLRNLMYTAQAGDHGPFAIRYPRGRGTRTDWRNDMHALPIGKGEKLAEGCDAVILSLGVNEAAKAVEAAKAKGLSVGLYDMIYLKPLDTELLREATLRNVPVITVEDGAVNGASAVLWPSGLPKITSMCRCGVWVFPTNSYRKARLHSCSTWPASMLKP